MDRTRRVPKERRKLTKEQKKQISAKVRETLYKRWQGEKDLTKNGRWIHTLTPTVEEWVLKDHGSMGYRLTQNFSNHGCFGLYLVKRGHMPNSNWRFCKEEQDNTEYTLFECPAHKPNRRRIVAEVGLIRLSKNNLVAKKCLKNQSLFLVCRHGRF